jgi:hypothetical protein
MYSFSRVREIDLALYSISVNSLSSDAATLFPILAPIPIGDVGAKKAKGRAFYESSLTLSFSNKIKPQKSSFLAQR